MPSAVPQVTPQLIPASVLHLVAGFLCPLLCKKLQIVGNRGNPTVSATGDSSPPFYLTACALSQVTFTFMLTPVQLYACALLLASCLLHCSCVLYLVSDV